MTEAYELVAGLLDRNQVRYRIRRAIAFFEPVKIRTYNGTQKINNLAIRHIVVPTQNIGAKLLSVHEKDKPVLVDVGGNGVDGEFALLAATNIVACTAQLTSGTLVKIVNMHNLLRSCDQRTSPVVMRYIVFAPMPVGYRTGEHAHTSAICVTYLARTRLI